MSWDACSRGPILNARQRWQRQEHDRRVRLLGEWMADEWESVVDDFTDASGKVHKEKVLQLMECVWQMAGGDNADERRNRQDDPHSGNHGTQELAGIHKRP